MAHEEVVQRYSGLARAALTGETVVDRATDAFDQGRFGTAGYDDTSGLPGGALRAGLGPGNSAMVQAAKSAIGPGLEIRPMRDADAEQVLAIYQLGLDTGQASFETTAPSWADFTASRPAHLRHIAVDTETGDVLAWVAAAPISSRPVYAGVVEHSIYVHPGCQAHGIGRSLLAAFIAASEEAGVWTIQSGIFPENAASLSLHQALGFRVVGTRERMGRHHGAWRDVLLIERRSPVTGA